MARLTLRSDSTRDALASIEALADRLRRELDRVDIWCVEYKQSCDVIEKERAELERERDGLRAKCDLLDGHLITRTRERDHAEAQLLEAQNNNPAAMGAAGTDDGR